MKTKTNSKQTKRKSFYKLLDSFEEKDFYAVKKFAEYIQTKNGKESLREILAKVPVDNEPLSDETLKRIEESRSEIKMGKYSTLKDVMKQYGL